MKKKPISIIVVLASMMLAASSAKALMSDNDACSSRDISTAVDGCPYAGNNRNEKAKQGKKTRRCNNFRDAEYSRCILKEENSGNSGDYADSYCLEKAEKKFISCMSKKD